MVTALSDIPFFSICIPTYGMAGKGQTYLHDCLEALTSQDFSDFEVVVSDQSDDLECQKICEHFAGRLQIRYVDFRNGARQASANTNNAIHNSVGRFIKVLFQDDYPCSDRMLSLQHEKLVETDARWLLVGSEAVSENGGSDSQMVPKWTDTIRFGKNTISSPSVLAFARSSELHFDESLIWLMDVEFYHRCKQELGDPAICTETLIANRLHENQVSSRVTNSIKRRELYYVFRLHRPRSWADWSVYLRQQLKTIL